MASKPVWGPQPETVANDKLNQMVDYSETIAGLGLLFAPNDPQPAGLLWAYRAGRVRNGATITEVAAAQIALTGSATNYIEVDSSGVVSKNTSAFSAAKKPIRVVTTDAGSVLTSVDKRVDFDFSNAPGGAAGGVLSGTYPNPGFAADMATQAELDAHTSNTGNPHGVTKAQVGLGNVINDAQLRAADLDTDSTFAANSDSKIPSQKAVKTALDAKANDADVVHDSGDETIAGVKTFSSSPVVPEPTTSAQAASKNYVDAATVGSVKYQGTWNASTNTPTMPAAATGNKGNYYKVATAGTTTVDGISEWNVGDWIISNGTVWDKVDNTEEDATSGSTGRIQLAGDLSGSATAPVVAADAIGDSKMASLTADQTTAYGATPNAGKPLTLIGRVLRALLAISGETNWYDAPGTTLATAAAHAANTSNPHAVTKTQVGLSSVTNDVQLKIASNLSDLNNAVTARVNLGVSGAAGMLDGNLLATGQETLSRLVPMTGNIVSGNGTLRFVYFTARKTETITQIKTYSGSTNSSGATLCRLGVYSVDGSGNLTLIGSTANDTGLWASTYTFYTKSTSSSFSVTAGQRYAIGLLCVGAAPTFMGSSAMLGSGAECLLAPTIGAVRTSQTDLPSSVAVGDLGGSGSIYYIVLLP